VRAAATPPTRCGAASPQPASCVCARRSLRLYDGTHPEHPLLIAIKGRVLDVREGAEYYGPEGPYTVMAGCDASKAFAMMSLKEEDGHPDLTGVNDDHLKILDDWCVSPAAAAWRGTYTRDAARAGDVRAPCAPVAPAPRAHAHGSSARDPWSMT
jgi:hypothetical protein